jgi:hypothetical protein
MISTGIMLKIIFVTAMINLISVLLVLTSCRCMNMWKLTSGLNKHAWFKRYFRWHCYIWYVLIPSIIIHAVFALKVMGIPF